MTSKVEGHEEGCAAYQDDPLAALVTVKPRVLIIVQNPPVPRPGKLGHAHLGVYQRLTCGAKILESAGEA